jgi:N-acetylglutamate synthase-like GNAT family acetyltransferase
MIDIVEVTHDRIWHLNGAAKKDKVCLKDTNTTKWFAIYVDYHIIGCAGIIIKGSKGRIRGVFILPEHRNKGYSSQLMSYIIKYMTDENVCYIDQLSSQPEWWIKNGWKEKSKALNGSWVYKTF